MQRRWRARRPTRLIAMAHERPRDMARERAQLEAWREGEGEGEGAARASEPGTSRLRMQ